MPLKEKLWWAFQFKVSRRKINMWNKEASWNLALPWDFSPVKYSLNIIINIPLETNERERRKGGDVKHQRFTPPSNLSQASCKSFRESRALNEDLPIISLIGTLCCDQELQKQAILQQGPLYVCVHFWTDGSHIGCRPKAATMKDLRIYKVHCYDPVPGISCLWGNFGVIAERLQNVLRAKGEHIKEHKIFRRFPRSNFIYNVSWQFYEWSAKPSAQEINYASLSPESIHCFRVRGRSIDSVICIIV